MKAQQLIQERLRQRLLEIKLKNPSVSVRGFAKQLKLPAGTVSLVLLGKRKISQKLATKFAQALYFDPIEMARVQDEYASIKEARKKTPQPRKPADKLKPENLRLSADQFHVMKDWYYFAILNLISTDDYQHDADWIASRIAIKPEIAKEALERLERLKLVTRTASGTIKRQHQKLNTTDEVQNLSLRYSHYQNLELAKTALDERALDERDFTWLTMPVDFKRMNEMKLMIRKFGDQFLEKFGQEKGANEVARMCVQLFPLTHPRKKEKIK